jgi:hypothetical protein
MNLNGDFGLLSFFVNLLKRFDNGLLPDVDVSVADL